MRVLMVTSFPIPGEYDGTAMLPIKIMRALRQRGVDVVMAYLRARPPWGAAARGEFEGTSIYEVPFWGWASGRGLSRIAREQPFDLVHAQHYGGATRAYKACQRHGWPMVYEIHSLLGEEVVRDNLGRGLVFNTYRAMEKGVLRHASAVITLGEPVKEVVVKEKGVPADRVSVIYPGIDLAEYESSGSAATIPGVGPEHKVVMYVGSIVHPNQGVPILIEALPRVFNAVPDSAVRFGRRPSRSRSGLPVPAWHIRRAADRADRPVARTGRRSLPPRRRLGTSAAGLPRELLGSEQDRRLSGRWPSDRGNRFRRLPGPPGSHRGGITHSRRPRAAGRCHHQRPDRSRFGRAARQCNWAGCTRVFRHGSQH